METHIRHTNRHPLDIVRPARGILPLILAVCASGCASARYLDRAPLWKEPDQQPIKSPKSQWAGIQWTGIRDAVLLRLDRGFTADFWREALNVNAWDEVPDSTWFHDLRRTDDTHAPPRVLGAPAVARGGFSDDDGPVLPLKVVKGKGIGSTPGLEALDARGVRYLLKLDPPKWIGLNTSTEVVATRLAWAAGWLVPAEKIINLREEDLVLDDKATTKDADDSKITFSHDLFDKMIAVTPRDADGTIRVCASRWLEGKPIGSWAYFGRRKDDPNDLIDHRDRRDVRAFGIFAAWVNDIDTFENNTLDTYVGKDGHGHVVHWQQDVGGSFGQFAAIPATVWMGEETYFMPSRIIGALLALGTMHRPWRNDERAERRDTLLRTYPQLGYFDDDTFDPRHWHPIVDNPAFVRQTKRDRYWGAKRIAAFTAEEVRAAVSLGHYPRDTEQRLFDILWRRREKILRAFLSDVASVDYFQPQGGKICFEDVWLNAGLGGDPRYTALDGDRAAPVLDRCVAVQSKGYGVVTIAVGSTTERPRREVRLHTLNDARGLRVLGVERL